MSSRTFYTSTIRLKSCFTNLLLPSILVKSNSRKIIRELLVHQPQQLTKPKIRLTYHVIPSLRKVNLRLRKKLIFATGPDDLGKLKALLRTITCLGISKSQFTLLHSALLQIDKEFFAIAGSSGSGKTTYAKLLQRKLGAKILANDYLLCKKEKNTLLVSDLNFATELKHKTPICPTALFICIPKEGIYENDVWQPHKKEFIKLITESFTYLPPNKAHALVDNFWSNINQDKTKTICINTRKRSIARTYRDFERIIQEILTGY